MMVREHDEVEAAPVRYCARHPAVETVVSCGRCDQPICPRCMIFTPVGARCPSCAQLRRLSQYALTPRVYARVVLGALLLALGIGFLLSVVPGVGFLGGIVVGYLIGTGLRRVSGYKQGREMEIIAGITVVLTVLAGNLFSLLRYGSHVDAALRVVFSAQFLGADAFGIVIGIYIAVQRLR
ncbi:MAG: hypothetical protein M3Y74_01120 [Chloroflexota bacterium]|nr:hypothetical protein [Chloroflexota bacterium]